MSRNRQIALSAVIVLAVTIPAYIAVNQLLWRAFNVNNPWLNGFFMGAFVVIGIVVGSRIISSAGKARRLVGSRNRR